MILAEDEDEDVTILDRIDIESSGFQGVMPGARPRFSQTIQMPQLQSINDWLESAAGVYGDTTGKGTRNVLVRGFETRQLNFQFAGVPLDTGYDGMTGLDTLPMNWVGAGRIAHADASATDAVGLGGKIDLYALDPKLFEANLETSLFGFIGSLAHGMKMGAWRWVATAGGQYQKGFHLSHSYNPKMDEDGGWRDYSYKAGANVFMKAGRSLGDWGDLEIMTGYAQSPRGVPTGVDTGYRRYWDFTNWRVAFASAKLSFVTEPIFGQVQLWATNQGNTLEAYDNSDRNTQVTEIGSTSVWSDYDIGGRIELNSVPWSMGSAGYMYALFRADMRYQTHDSRETFHSTGNETHIDSSRLYYDLRPALNWNILENLTVFAGGNYAGAIGISSNDTTGLNDVALEDLHNGGFSAGIDYRILDNLELDLRAARRLRMPTLKEQFRSIPLSDIHLPNLNPEVAWDFEAEIHYRPIEEVSITVGVFDAEIDDLIVFLYTNGTKLAYNVDESRMAGVDIALSAGPFAGFTLDAAYHYLYAYDLSRDHVLNDRPAHNVRAALHYSPLDNLRITVGCQFESKRRTEAWLSTKYAWIGNVFLLDAEVEYKLENVSLYLRGTNLLDYNYQRAFGYPEPGVNVTLGAKLVYD